MKLTFTASFVLATALACSAQTFKYVAIDFPNSQSTTANGINNAGTIVGSYVSSAGHTHGYRLQGGKFTTIDYPNSARTEVNGINDYGDVVGTYQLAGSQLTHGFIRYHTGNFKALNDPRATSGTTALGINKYLTVVGSYFNSGNQHGYIYKGGTFTTVDAPTNSFPDTVLNDISNTGVIVGQVFSGDSWRGLWKVGSDLDFLEPFLKPDNIVYGVNGHTDLVGVEIGKGFFVKSAEASESEGSAEKFPAKIPIQFQSFLNTQPRAINYSRSIVGWYYDNNFVQHGFLAVAQ
jgi:hypothetical protein